MCWTTTRGHLEHVVEWIEMWNGSNKIGKFYIQPKSRWSGSTIDSLIGWSAGAANPCGLRIQPIWTPQIFFFFFYLWGFLKDNGCENNTQSLAELKVAINQKIRAIVKKSASRWLTTSLDEFKCVISAMAVIWNTSCKKCILWARYIKSMFF